MQIFQSSGQCRYPNCNKRFNRPYEVIRHLAKIHGKKEYTVLDPIPYLDIREPTLHESSDERLLEVGATTRRCIPRLRKMLREINDEFGHLRRAYVRRQSPGWQRSESGGAESPAFSWSGDDECSQVNLSTKSHIKWSIC